MSYVRKTSYVGPAILVLVVVACVITIADSILARNVVIPYDCIAKTVSPDTMGTEGKYEEVEITCSPDKKQPPLLVAPVSYKIRVGDPIACTKTIRRGGIPGFIEWTKSNPRWSCTSPPPKSAS